MPNSTALPLNASQLKEFVIFATEAQGEGIINETVMEFIEEQCNAHGFTGVDDAYLDLVCGV